MVDDHPVLREGIAAILAAEPGMVLVGEAGNGHEAIEQFRRHRPDVVLMDLQMPVMNGTDAIRAIRAGEPSGSHHRAHNFQRRRACETGVSRGRQRLPVEGHGAQKGLLETIRSVHAGHKRIPPSIAAALAEHVADDMS